MAFLQAILRSGKACFAWAAGARRTGFSCAALIASLAGADTAAAQCINTNFNFGAFKVTAAGGRNLIPTANPLISIINTVNTAFLTNTVAFVSSPPATGPDQNSGGIWTRSIAGYVDSTAKSTSVVGSFLLPPIFVGDPPFPATGTQHCRQTNHQNYVGLQAGADIARINLGGSGVNLHVGVTGGNFDAKVVDTTKATPLPDATYAAGDLRSHFQVPFVGVYGTLLAGNFFADAQVRWDFFDSNSSSKIQDFRSVSNDAQGISLTTSMGYRINLPANWFVEPAVGVVWSRVNVDPVTLLDRDGEGVKLRVDDIDSLLGRASLRIGTTVTQGSLTWQPFASATVVREFAGAVKSTVETVVFPFPGMPFNTTTERLGTYGQFTLGSSVVLGNSGWLGYARGDYKTGENIKGAGVNAGLRYQW